MCGIRILAALLLGITLEGWCAQERVLLFDSDITVHTDASLTVREKIAVFAQGKQIVRGIVREIPTRYRDRWGTAFNIRLSLEHVIHQGLKTAYRLVDAANGIKIYIGDIEKELSPGVHVYEIVYKTERQLGFFEGHDELYWNVTGSGWRLPIELVRARVHLPEGATIRELIGYTGGAGARGADYTHATSDNTATFATTRPFDPFEGFTIAVSWPKGIVQEPLLQQKLCWFFEDNWSILWIFLGWLLALLLVIHVAINTRRANRPGTVIPRFYPPEGYTPAAVGFMKYRGFSNLLLPADIIQLAVRGFLTIKHEGSKWLNADRYVLAATPHAFDEAEVENQTEYEKKLLVALFNESPTVEVGAKSCAAIEAARTQLKLHCVRFVGRHIKKQELLYALLGGALLLWMLPIAFFDGVPHPIAVPLYLLVFWLLSRYIRAYTKPGRALQDEIDGFELFLRAAEVERMKMVGTPPTKTPELYETYLPYAMALGAEEEWTKQFAPVFEQMEKKGHVYHPVWYAGAFRSHLFASQFGSTISKSIAAASSPPGRSSGFGGGGGSGGGGGGGGGGGW